MRVEPASIGEFTFVEQLTGRFGGQSIAISIDEGKRGFGGRPVFSHLGRNCAGIDPIEHAQQRVRAGADELVIRSIIHDWLMEAVNHKLVAEVSAAVSVPAVANGCVGPPDDIGHALEARAHAVSVGSIFVCHGPHRAMLFNYPELKKIQRTLGQTTTARTPE